MSSRKRSSSGAGKKRHHHDEEVPQRKLKDPSRPKHPDVTDKGEDELLQFEDDYEDEFESEEDAVENGNEDRTAQQTQLSAQDKKRLSQRIYRPGMDSVDENEALIHDPSAYDMYHKAGLEWPALSFDFLRDNIEGARNVFPMTAFAVAGSQATQAAKNNVVVVKLSQLRKTKKKRRKDLNDDDDDEDSEDDDDDSDSDLDTDKGDPVLENVNIKHDGGINRIRSMPQEPNIVATWAETGRVNVYDINPCLQVLNRGSRMPHPNDVKPSSVKPFFVCNAHKAEGFAMDWNPLVAGRMVTGAMNRSILLWERREDGRFFVDTNTFRGHTDSVEDLQWSPTESDVFASCSVDKSIQFWDIRLGKKKSALTMPNAHDQDVNVISWNRTDSHLLVSGGDEGSIKVWDLRAIKDGEANPAAYFNFHNKAITSVEWHPTQSSMLAASSEDHSVSIWDLSVERDPEEEAALGEVVPGAENLPAQLLFLHMGQKQVKEIHWHPQLPSVMMSTAAEGLDIFRPADIW